MDIQAEKLQLISELLQVSDETLIAKMKNLLKKTKEVKKYLPADEEEYILKKLDESDKDIKAGRVYTMNEVKAHIDQKFRNL